MKLQNKLILLTGGTGNIGREILQKCLEEGAEVIVTSRSWQKLEDMKSELQRINPSWEGKIHPIVIDGTSFDSIMEGVFEIRSRFKNVDVIINNAGSAGPKQLLTDIPLSKHDLENLEKKGFQEKETLQDAFFSIFGFPWILTGALLHHLSTDASIINISTIFSKTPYFGRIAYVTPKAALNALGHLMAVEIAKKGKKIRVNTVFPGPVESERIRNVFSAMDLLQDEEQGTTEKYFVSKMLLSGDSNFISKQKVADTILFLAGDSSSEITDHSFEVTRGLQIQRENTLELVSIPNPKIVSLDGHFVWIVGGYSTEDAYAIAQKHYDKGAEILLTFRGIEALKDAEIRFKNQLNFTMQLFEPSSHDDWRKVIQIFSETMHFPTSVFVLPHHSPQQLLALYGESIIDCPIEKIQAFIVSELLDALIMAKWLAKMSARKKATSFPPIVFVSNPAYENGNHFDQIRSAAIEQMIRVWRQEEMKDAEGSSPRIWQLVRYTNAERGNLEYTANIAISISAKITTCSHLNIAICPQIVNAPASVTFNPKYHQMLSDLEGTTALITGGSEGIGRETTRILVQGGAEVVIASRNEDKLVKTKKFLVKELSANGFPEAETRIHTLSVDVQDEDCLHRVFDQVLSSQGKIDFLINNAGIAGEEQLVVDMSVEGWKKTLFSNLTSNYLLMLKALPGMKKRGKGYVVNISSAFGGLRFANAPYPLRADYAVTKAGQRALAECFAPLLGPEVKINAIAPGPVEGDRLRGNDARPGLYYRRAMMNAENKRLELMYDALMDCSNLTVALDLLCLNVIEKAYPLGMKDVIDKIKKDECKDSHSSSSYLVTKVIMKKLLERLILGQRLPATIDSEALFLRFSEPPEPFFSTEELRSSADRILERILRALALEKMPTEYDVSREIVFNLSSHCMTGQTLYPTGGLALEQLAVAGEFSGYYSDELYKTLKAPSVTIIGDAMYEEMAHVAACLYKASGVGKILILTASSPGQEKILLELSKRTIGPDSRLIIKHSSIEAIAQESDLLISFPMSTLPAGDDWQQLPNITLFKDLIETHLTNHFQVAKRGALIDKCRVFFVTHPSSNKDGTVLKALSQFFATSVAALTATVGQECQRICHKAQFIQLNACGYGNKEAYLENLQNALLILSNRDQRETRQSKPGRIFSLTDGFK